MAVSDDFNRANAATLGANWTDFVGGGQIVGNAARAELDQWNFCGYTAVEWANDQSSAIVGVGTFFVYAMACVRLNAEGDGYGVLARGGGDEVKIYRLDNGTITEIHATGVTSVVGDEIGIVATGTSLQATKNGSNAGTAVTDATYASGVAGIGLRWNEGSGEINSWAGTGEVSGPTAGVASFVSSAIGTINLSATDATGGTAPYTYQWERSPAGEDDWDALADGGGVSGATTLELTDGSVGSSNPEYDYRLVYTDDNDETDTSNEVACVYLYRAKATDGERTSAPSGVAAYLE